MCSRSPHRGGEHREHTPPPRAPGNTLGTHPGNTVLEGKGAGQGQFLARMGQVCSLGREHGWEHALRAGTHPGTHPPVGGRPPLPEPTLRRCESSQGHKAAPRHPRSPRRASSQVHEVSPRPSPTHAVGENRKSTSSQGRHRAAGALSFRAPARSVTPACRRGGKGRSGGPVGGPLAAPTRGKRCHPAVMAPIGAGQRVTA